ncbi:hypothetical protein KKK_20360 [Pseudomonas putida B6-2]|nr:hypothetical protein KKK_20360 [Pseudomonas putida B6-2]
MGREGMGFNGMGVALCRDWAAQQPQHPSSILERWGLCASQSRHKAPQGLRQALDVYGDFQGFQRRLDLDAQRCTQLHYPGLMGGFAVMMFLDTALG